MEQGARWNRTSWIWIVAVLLAWTAQLRPTPVRAADTPPDVLFIAIDDLNSWIGPLDTYFGVKTPNLDRLAKRGLLFTHAYCAAPACNPSRAALLTGRAPSTSGVYHNDQPWRPVMPDAVTLPQHFHANGYEAVGGGKIFHNAYNDRASWDTYFAIPGSPSPKNRPVNGLHKAQFDWGPVDVPDERMGDYKTASWAIDQLNAEHSKPLFLAVGFIRPHLPWYVPQKYFDMYPLDRIRKPEVDLHDLDDIPRLGREMALAGGDHEAVVSHQLWEKAIQGYLASISFADAQLGRVLDALDKSPRASQTLVVVWGDHGWHLGEKEHWRKFTLWEEATRTPLIIAGPGINPGQCETPVSLMDLYPTLIDYCGLSPRANLEATSLSPLLRDPKAPWLRPAVMTHGRGNHAVRSSRWRYIRYSDGTEELYDHDEDPHEWKNRASDPSLTAVKQGLARWLPKIDAPDAPHRGDGGE